MKIDEDNYRAALYSMPIDFSKYQQLAPEIQYSGPESIIAYKYYIQYGIDTFIEIIDPGYEINSFKGCIRKLDYSKRESTFTCIVDQTGTYHTTKEPIAYSIEESKGSITDLCEGIKLNSSCDSVKFLSNNSNADYTIIFNDTISNLHSIDLCYPDMKFLPKKIIGVGQNKNTLTLEELFYGKSSIDSILQLFSYKGYKQVTDEEMDPDGRQFVIDLLEKLKCKGL
jgi:hypothetical protein